MSIQPYGANPFTALVAQVVQPLITVAGPYLLWSALQSIQSVAGIDPTRCYSEKAEDDLLDRINHLFGPFRKHDVRKEGFEYVYECVKQGKWQELKSLENDLAHLTNEFDRTLLKKAIVDADVASAKALIERKFYFECDIVEVITLCACKGQIDILGTFWDHVQGAPGLLEATKPGAPENIELALAFNTLSSNVTDESKIAEAANLAMLAFELSCNYFEKDYANETDKLAAQAPSTQRLYARAKSYELLYRVRANETVEEFTKAALALGEIHAADALSIVLDAIENRKEANLTLHPSVVTTANTLIQNSSWQGGGLGYGMYGIRAFCQHSAVITELSLNIALAAMPSEKVVKLSGSWGEKLKNKYLEEGKKLEKLVTEADAIQAASELIRSKVGLALNAPRIASSFGSLINLQEYVPAWVLDPYGALQRQCERAAGLIVAEDES